MMCCLGFKGGYGLQFLVFFFFFFFFFFFLFFFFFFFFFLVVMVFNFLFFFFFFFFSLSLQIDYVVAIFRIWLKHFVCKLSVLLWTIALYVGGCLGNLSIGKSRNKKKIKELAFCREEDQENNFWNAISLSLSLLLSLCHSFSLHQFWGGAIPILKLLLKIKQW